MTLALRVLQVEDVEDDAHVVELELRRGGFAPTCRRVETAEEMTAALREETWDVVLSDFRLPGFDAPAALRVLQGLGLDVPFVIISGVITEETAVAAMRAGAHDWISKANLQRLVPVVQRELREARSRRALLQAQAHGRRVEARFRTLVDSIDGLVFTLDAKLVVDGVFGRGLGQGRLEEAHYLGKRLGELFGDDPRAPDDAICGRALSGEPTVHEWAHHDPLGGQFLQLALTPIVMEDGQVHGLVGIVRDVTASKRVEAQLLQADRLASIGAVAATVGHEINNPLAALLADLETVSRELLAASAKPQAAALAADLVPLHASLGDMREAAQRLREVTRDLHSMARASEDRRAPTDLHKVLESSIRMAWNEIRHRARLVRDFSPAAPVLASDARLGQVFLNLLVNAAQAIVPGNAEGNQVRVRVGMHGPRHALVEVADTGQGIPDAVKQQLFMPFYTTKPEGLGTGLGLSICQRIVADFGGYIAVESTVGEGSTFRVILPTTTQAFAEGTAAPAPVRATRRGQVLVVDDEPMLQRAISRSLAPAHDVVTLGNGRAALAVVEGGKRFDVIFCDLMMPEMTGVELYAAMVASAPRQAERIVFLTGGAFSDPMHAFLDAVPNLTVEKPFESAVLLDIVARHVDGAAPPP